MTRKAIHVLSHVSLLQSHYREALSLTLTISGAEAKIEINHGGRTSEADIQKMIQDAAIFRRDDEVPIRLQLSCRPNFYAPTTFTHSLISSCLVQAALAQTEARNSLDHELFAAEQLVHFCIYNLARQLLHFS